MSAQDTVGKFVAKLADDVADPIVEHGLHDFHITSVTVQTVEANDNDFRTVEERTVALPPYKVLDRDRIQLTLATAADTERWVVVSA